MSSLSEGSTLILLTWIDNRLTDKKVYKFINMHKPGSHTKYETQRRGQMVEVYTLPWGYGKNGCLLGSAREVESQVIGEWGKESMAGRAVLICL